MKLSGALIGCFFLVIINFCLFTSLEADTAADFDLSGGEPISSVLEKGQWYKLGVPDHGIYKIDYDYLKGLGLDVNQIDPRNIKLYGYGGGMLPQGNSEERLQDLVENAIVVTGEGDGTFDKNDYILFYAERPDLYRYDIDKDHFFYQKNLYADSVYYFLTVSDTEGSRVQRRENFGINHHKITVFDDYAAHEIDKENILGSGREWYGEKFDLSTSQSLPPFRFPGITNNSEIKVVSAVLGQSNSPSSFSLKVNDFILGEQKLTSISVGTYDKKGFDHIDTLSANANLLSLDASGELKFNYTFKKGSFGTSAANLNYLFVTVKRDLALYGSKTAFRSVESLNHPFVTYLIKDSGQDVNIWDITDPQNSMIQDYAISNGDAAFGANAEKLREFIVFKGTDFPAPGFVHLVKNQNLHGIKVPELLIVAHAQFRQEAERLAQFREQHDNIKVHIVTTSEIYNEFSSGRQDITAIRDYVKYLYDRDNGPEGLKYLLLFGKCSYDYKNYLNGNTNFVPTYESINSLNPVETYSSDDYFGFLNDHEGDWPEDHTNQDDHVLDIGVGRLPIKSIEEAKVMVDKMIHYSSNRGALGAWRNEVFLVADDGDRNIHQKDAEKLAVLADSTYLEYNINKVYVDAFPQETTPNGESAQPVREEINNAVKKGTLIINYIGHGAETGWAEENILSTNMINSWENYDRLPLFVTATCEFGRHDDPKRISGGELLMTNPKGGAIGLVTTSRPVFSSTNFLLNQAFVNTVFETAQDSHFTLGEIIKETKNQSIRGVRNRNFSLLGDPSMKLAYPENKVVISEINERGISSSTDTLKALSKITLKGHVQSNSGQVLSNYNGVANVTIFDTPSVIETLGNEPGPTMTFEQRENVIFRGQVSVKKGEFEIKFIVPRNITYTLGNAKVSLYAIDDNSMKDASGAHTNLVIGGSDNDAPLDITPPEITLFMDDTTFVPGGITGSNTLLLARLFDENGINISSNGLGHNITALINEEQFLTLNDFYQTELDSYKRGWVSYPINDLPEGSYTVQLKAWDTHNNASERSIDFIVADDAELVLEKIFNYPNPFSDKTQFVIKHNRAGENLSVKIIIYSIKGELIGEIEGHFQNSSATIGGLVWNGRTDFGKKLDNGIYIYKVIVQSLQDSAKNQQLQKLVIIN